MYADMWSKIPWTEATPVSYTHLDAVKVLLGLRIQEKTRTSQLHETIEPAQERV